MAEHKVNIFFTAPTAFRAIRKEDPDGALINQYDLGALKSLFWQESEQIRRPIIG